MAVYESQRALLAMANTPRDTMAHIHMEGKETGGAELLKYF